jgi:hypothetical protein
VQIPSQTVADRARCGSKVPDVRALDWSRDNEQRLRCVVFGVVAKAPKWTRGNDLIGTFVRVEPKRSECMPLCAPQDVGDTELNPAVGVQCRIDRNARLPQMCFFRRSGLSISL